MEKVRISTIFASIQYSESGSGKHQGSEMCAIGFPHKFIPREVISNDKNLKIVEKITLSEIPNVH